jgi:histidine ammonia-lyase/tyrosine ammonia-lyase
LDPRLHRARGHAGQIQSAEAIRQEAERGGEWEDATRPLQDIYSMRCAPQVLGACRENLDYARQLIETEMNGVNDNPLIFSAEASGREPAVAHGGNFHAQQVAFAADALNAALTQAGMLVERQIDALLDPRINGNAPLLLAWEPGATSGMAGAQITATALAAELRMNCQSYATSTIPTNGGNQDIVPMGTLAARKAYAQTELLAPILAVAGMALVQLNFLRERGRATGNALLLPDWMPSFEPFENDRALHPDIERIAQAWLAVRK